MRCLGTALAGEAVSVLLSVSLHHLACSLSCFSSAAMVSVRPCLFSLVQRVEDLCQGTALLSSKVGFLLCLALFGK